VRSRGLAGLICAALSGLLGLGCNWISAARPSGPSVLLVTIDTLRADHVGAYGAEGVETPTLDGLAARGVLFEQAMASVPLTLPSHASLLTGQYPPTHGVRHNAIFTLSDEAESMAERFQAQGFDTGAVIGAAVLDPDFGLDQGFDHYDDALPKERATSAGFYERPAAQVTDAALDWLGTIDGPFFLWVHYYDPHASYSPPEPWKQRFAKRPYDGEVASVDHAVGRLLDGLEGDGRLAETIVAVTSDHGEGLGEHGEGSHTYLIYDSVLRVPMILAGPGLPEGRRVAPVTPNTGLAATLLALTGTPALTKTDVGDLSPLWSEAPAGADSGWAYAESLAGELDHGWAPIHAIRSAGHHYIRAPRPELFDTASDPKQLENLLPTEEPEPAAVVERDEQRISALLANQKDLSPVEVDDETRAQIEALGYVVPKGEAVKNGADPKDVHRLGDVAYGALALLFAKRYEECEKLALSGLEMLPESSQLHDILASLYTETREFDPALAHAMEAARLRPHWGDFQAQVGYVHLLRGELPEAVAAFQHAVEVDPKHAGAHSGVMWRLKLGGSLEEAEEHARLALELEPDRPGLVERVAEVWESLGQYERALEIYRDGAERFPDNPEFRMRLAIQYARFGRDEEAAAQRKLAGKAAENVNLRNRLGIVYAARREFDRAEPIFREILGQNPEEPSTLRFLARMLRETGREEEAKALVADLDASGPLAPAPGAPSELPPRG
jgi:arylsulfatase A-like enzyme/Flp pilus assembly protein TadD